MKTYNIVSVSGGKDSTATLLLAIERGAENLMAVFADTGHEHPTTYEYLDDLERVTGVKIRRVKADFSKQIAHKRTVVQTKWRNEYLAGVPGQYDPLRSEDGAVIGWIHYPAVSPMSEAEADAKIAVILEALVPTGNPFLDLCLWKGRFPSSKARFCTDELKRNPIFEQVFLPLLECEDCQIISWQGVRADESLARSKLSEMEDATGGLFNYRPILTWTAAEVFAFHTRHGIRWNPLYEQGMGRVGCMPCINCRKAELHEIAERFPWVIEMIGLWEKLVSQASKRGSATFFAAVNDPTVSRSDVITHETHGIARMVEWSKTARGGRQFDLIASAGGGAGCKSSYGLCEMRESAA